MDKQRKLIVGCFGKTHGLDGWINLKPYTEPAEQILQYQPWYIQRHQQFYPIQTRDYHYQSQNFQVLIDGIENVDEAKNQLTGRYIFITRQQLPSLASGEYYWDDLEQLAVYTIDGQYLGKVKRLIATGANDVLVVKNGRERIIPYISNDVIIEVNLFHQYMIVSWDPEF